MNKYFGTDGIRGIYGKTLTPDLAFRTGRAIVKYYGRGKYIIARDSRVSGEILEDLVIKGIAAEGGKALDIGIMPTPACAYFTKMLGAKCGVVISASHNPPEYNGIKLFCETGLKPTDDKEAMIEYFIDTLVDREALPKPYETIEDAKSQYADYVASHCTTPLDGITIRLDCGYGACAKIAPKIFRRLGANVIAYNDEYIGNKINVGVGALHPEFLLAQMKSPDEIGFSYDGDGDRLCVVMHNEIIDGDTIIYHLSHSVALKDNIVVGTIMNNLALEETLAAEGVRLIRTPVGDKYISNEMFEHGYTLGGEQSGHYIINKFCATGDAILSGVYLLETLISDGKVRAPHKLNLCPQKAISLRAEKSIVTGDGMKRLIGKAKRALGFNGRLIVRMSGTEPKVRVMIESRNTALIDEYLQKFEEYITSQTVETAEDEAPQHVDAAQQVDASQQDG